MPVPDAMGYGLAVGRGDGGRVCFIVHPFKFGSMALTTKTTDHISVLDIIHDRGAYIGHAIREESGFWVFFQPDSSGYMESHTLREIADLLDTLNKPYNEELERYFSSQKNKENDLQNSYDF